MPIPIGNPATALRLSERYDLKGKVGLQHDEIVVATTLLEDLTPPLPATQFQRANVTAALNTQVSANATGPALGFRRFLKHLSIAVRFTVNPAAGDIAIGYVGFVEPLGNLSLDGVILEAGTAPSTAAFAELATGLATDFSFDHDPTPAHFLTVRADARASSVAVEAILSYAFIDIEL